MIPICMRSKFISLGLLLLVTSGFSLEKKPAIVVLKSRDIPQYNIALNGFTRALRDNRIRASLLQYTVRPGRLDAVLIKNIHDAEPAVIVSIGTVASEQAKEIFPEMPVVFCMVLDPVAAGLIESMEHPGGNVTGASMDISLRQQFAVMRSVMPGTKKVGALYCPAQTNALIREAAGTAKSAGLEFIPLPIQSERDLPKALKQVTRKKIDCLWTVPDRTVFGSIKSIRFIIHHTLQQGVPLMGLASPFVKAGALFAVTCDPYDNGYQAGTCAASILNGRKPSDLRVTGARKTFLSINAKIANKINVAVPSTIYAEAEEIFR